MNEAQAQLLTEMRDKGKVLALTGAGWRAMGYDAEVVTEVIEAGWASESLLNQWQQSYRTISQAGIEALAIYEGQG